MTVFRFRLEPLLELRRRQREAEEAKLARMIADKQRLEWRRAELLRSSAAARANVANEARWAAADLQAIGRYAEAVAETCRAIQATLHERNREIEKQRRAVAVRQRDEELLEGLRGQEYDEWRKASENELESLAADSFLASWNRRARAGKRADVTL